MEKLKEYIDVFHSEGNGYISENNRNLLLRYAIKNKYLSNTKELDELIEERLSQFNEKIKCPNCGALFSKLLHLCDSCNYIMPGAHTSSISIQTIVDNLENSIAGIKSAPKPTFLGTLNEQYLIILPYLSAFSFLVAWLFSKIWGRDPLIIFGTIGVFFAILSIIGFIYSRKKTKFDRKSVIKNFTQNFIKTKQLAERHFGNEASVNALVKNYETALNKLKTRNAFRWLHIIIIYLTIFAGSGYAIHWILQQDSEKNERRRIESDNQLMKPFYNQKIVIHPHQKAVSGFLAEKIKVPEQEVFVKFVDTTQYVNSYLIRVDSIKLESIGKIDLNKPLNLYLDVFDDKGNPVIFNTLLHCTNNEAFSQFVAKGNGSAYFSFCSDVKNIDTQISKKMSLKDIRIYSKAKVFKLKAYFY